MLTVKVIPKVSGMDVKNRSRVGDLFRVCSPLVAVPVISTGPSFLASSVVPTADPLVSKGAYK